jgi:hypothetical protein
MMSPGKPPIVTILTVSPLPNWAATFSAIASPASAPVATWSSAT